MTHGFQGFSAPPAQQAPINGDLLGEWGDLPLTAFFRLHAGKVTVAAIASAVAATLTIVAPFILAR